MAKFGQLDIFGEETAAPERRKGRNEIFNDYEAYIAKFGDGPKTTDDTYTSPDVFEAVLEWLKGKGKGGGGGDGGGGGGDGGGGGGGARGAEAFGAADAGAALRAFQAKRRKRSENRRPKDR